MSEEASAPPMDSANEETASAAITEIDSTPVAVPPDLESISTPAVDVAADAISHTRKITIVEPEKPGKASTDEDAPVASASGEGDPQPPEEEEEFEAAEEEQEEEEENADKGDFEEDDEEDELEEAYFWHGQIIDELKRVCRDSDPRNAYKILDSLSTDRLGRMSYTARAARTGEVVVVKSCVLEAPVEKFTGQRLITELFLMRDMLSHPNVVSFYDLYLVEEAEVWLVTEYMAGGVTLGDIISKTASRFSEEQVARICLEACKGLAHLHSQLIIHRDMRSDSIIIDPKGRVKLTGLAFSVQLPDKAAKRRTMVSTLTLPNRSPYTVDKTHWTAPEVIKRKEYGFEVDVWAFGITMVEMIDGAPPYAGQEPLKVLFLILVNGTPELKEPDALSDEIKDFLSDCLAVDVAQRSSMSELLEHEFLKKACPASDLAPLLEFKPEPGPEPEPESEEVVVEPESLPETADSVVPPQPTEESAAEAALSPVSGSVEPTAVEASAAPDAADSTTAPATEAAHSSVQDVVPAASESAAEAATVPEEASVPQALEPPEPETPVPAKVDSPTVPEAVDTSPAPGSA
ncbi:Pkinase-domain-containing protein [Mycena venus]|uniref:Pkinase-domain-containing protein n=1 Tax=Mycena venus TaxID=2733690 RepID=A0A8H6X2E7_9AGAR|nr:Pkinase-domain-containing protein [Mycena venus]